MLTKFSMRNNVTSLSNYRERLRFPAINEVEAYWEALRTPTTIPARRDIDPRGMVRILSYAFVLERIAPRVGRLRVAGRHLDALAGQEVRGMPFCTFFTPQARLEMAEMFMGVFDKPQVVNMNIEAERGLGKPALDGAISLLPVRDEAGAVTRALGVLQTEGRIGRHARRFDITSYSEKPVAPYHAAPQHGEPSAMEALRAEIAKEKEPHETRPALRLVVSDS